MIGIYARVSTLQQADRYSLDIQEKRGIAFANSQGEPYLIYKEAESGSSIIARDQLKQMFSDIERGIIKKVFVIEFSRISRDVEDATFIKNLFLKHKCQLYEDSRLMDLTRPESLLSYHVTSAVSEYERSRLIERVRRAKDVEMNSGRRTFGKLYGYNWRFLSSGKREWFINEEEAKVIRLAYDLFESGMTIRAITIKLNDAFLKRRVGTNWHSNQVGRILKHLEYTGFTRNKDKKIIPSLVFQPIIEFERWKKLQSSMKKAAPGRNFRTRFEDHLATGLIRCSECSARYYANNKRKTGFLYYAHSAMKGCDQRPTYIHSDLTEKFLEYVFYDVHSRDDELKKFLEMKETEIVEERGRISENTERLQKRLQDLDTQKTRLVAAVASATLSEEDIRSKIQEIKKETDIIQKKLLEVSKTVTDKKNELDRLLEEFSESRIDEWKKATIGQRRKMLQGTIKSALTKGETLRVVTVTDKEYSIKTKNTPAQIVKMLENAHKKLL